MSKKRNLIILAEIGIADFGGSPEGMLDVVLSQLADYLGYQDGETIDSHGITITEIASQVEIYEKEDEDPVIDQTRRYVADDYWSQWLPKRIAIVEVLGGVASIEECPEDIDLHIHDLDLERIVPEAQRMFMF